MYYCNPLNIEYKYQIHEGEEECYANREAADPSIVLYGGRYYLFASMTYGFFVSDDLIDWKYQGFKQEMPVYDYAPDVRVIGEYMYFCASHREKNCSFYRTKDPIEGIFEEIEGTFPFWDPNLFQDEDGKVYLYWGCSNITPIYGVELNSKTMAPVGEKTSLINSDVIAIGFERNGENHMPQKSQEDIEAQVTNMLKNIPNPTEEQKKLLYRYMGNAPYIEGAWMTKKQRKYYLQYSAPGTQFNVYADGTYVSNHPLGPFELAKNNPYSYKPGGFIPGAGHGSTLEDRDGNYWHTATMVISMNHSYERRLGLWKAGFDDEGELFCDQRYGDWPIDVDKGSWAKPDWMLLSYGKKVTGSSGNDMMNVTDENIRTWWKAETPNAGEWIQVDLGKVCKVHAVQMNFADDSIVLPLSSNMNFKNDGNGNRLIDSDSHVTRWILEGSVDGVEYFIIEDKSSANTDLAHDLIVKEDGFQAKYVKLTILEVPFNQAPCLSGIRIFGLGSGRLPKMTKEIKVERLSDLDMQVSWQEDLAIGHTILWGHDPQRLYHSCMVFGANEKIISALIVDSPVYVRVDAFNECGINEEGEVYKLMP